MILLKADKAIEHKADKGLKSGLQDQLSELEDNGIYLYKNLETNEDNSKDNWFKEDFKCKNSDIEVTTTNTSSNQAKKKLVQIFKGEVLIF